MHASKSAYSYSFQSVCYLNVRQWFVQYCTLHTGLLFSATGNRELEVSGTLRCTVRFPAKGKNSSVLQSVQTGPVAFPAPIKGVSGVVSLGNKVSAVRSEQLTTYLMVMLRTSGDILPSPTTVVHKFPRNQRAI